MVERSETHHASAQGLMGFAALYPSYELPRERIGILRPARWLYNAACCKSRVHQNPVVGIMSCAAW
jgi:hypothetical protein